MKTKILYLLSAMALGYLFTGCENQESETAFSGKVVSFSICKDLKSVPVDTPDTISCVRYSFNKSKKRLTLEHINTGFNCCPGNLYCEVEIKNNSILISEYEQKKACRCNCLYDIVIEVDGVKADKYQVRFIEPYAENMEELVFEANLAENPAGTFCVTRKEYPWGKLTVF
jgi:hypothetical protein